MPKNNNKTLEQWLDSPKVSEPLKAQLRALQRAAEAGEPQARAQAQETLADCLSQELEFGTSGLRGKLGAGNNRMNFHTVTKATQGLSTYLLAHSQGPRVCLAYDSRHMSRRFAEGAARVLCANGLKVWMFPDLRPTPMLSFAIRQLQASAGIVITASHNPREFSGYKVYGAYGGQITGQQAEEITDHIGQCDLFESPRLMDLAQAEAEGLFNWISPQLDRLYYDRVAQLVCRKDLVASQGAQLHILYTPLYGTGAQPVSQVLREMGFSLDCVAEQMRPDGDFPTTPYPNPEKLSVYSLAQTLGAQSAPDLIVATDPDCDRFGVMVRNQQGSYQLLTGNQQGVLLCHYLLEWFRQQGKLGDPGKQGHVYATIVSTDRLEKLCRHYGVIYQETLTGFKYIAEKVENLPLEDPGGSFIFAMEESNGCMVGDFVRDKDGVMGVLLTAEMALYYKTQGRTLLEELEAMDAAYGYSREETLFFAMPGQKGQRLIRHIMNDLRQNWQTRLAPIDPERLQDYLLGVGDLPTSNVLKFYCTDESWLALRPSGTEAKFKIYLSAKGANGAETTARLGQLRQMAFQIVGSEAVLANDDEG